MGCGSFDLEFTFTIAFETDELVWYETISYRQRETVHRKTGIELSVVHIMVAATEQAEFFAVEQQVGFDGMRTIFLHKVNHFRADVSDG